MGYPDTTRTYLCLPKPLDIWGDNQAPVEDKHSAISLNPGVRTFVTMHAQDNDEDIYEGTASVVPVGALPLVL